MEHQLNLPITGMHCENCANTITRHLKKMEGILAAEVSLATEYAAVTFDAATLSEETIVDKIRDLGLMLLMKTKKMQLALRNSDDKRCNSLSG